MLSLNPAVLLWAIGLFICTSPLTPVFDAFFPAGNEYMRYATYAVGLGSFVWALLHGTALIRLLRNGVSIVFFLSIPLLLLPFASNLEWSISQVLRFYAQLAFIIGFAATQPRDRILASITVTFLISLLLSIGVAKAFPAVGTMEAGESDVRSAALWRGIYVHKNVLGHLAGLGVVVGLYTFRLNLKAFVVGGVLIGASALCIWYSQSASSYILTLAGILFYVAVYTARTRLGKIVVLAGSGLAITIAAIASSSGILEQLLLLLGKDTTLTGRADIWADGWQIFTANAATGYGYGYTFSTQITEWLLGKYGINHFHNAYLDLAINLGVVGVVVLLLIVGQAVYKSIVARTDADDLAQRAAAFSLLGGCLASGFSESLMIRPSNPVSSIFLLAILVLLSFEKSTAYPSGEYDGSA